MPNKTLIEWTDYSSNAIYAFDPLRNRRGWHCVHVSEGCRNCYAEAINKRFGTGHAYTAQNAAKIEFRVSDKELEGLRKLNAKEPGAKVFVGDMLDIFQYGPSGVSDQLLDQLFDTLEACTNLTFQLLTKHPVRAKGFLTFRWKDKPVPSHIWLGTSVEDQKTADERIPLLLDTPAAVRWISAEPLLGPIEFSDVTKRCDAVRRLGKGSFDGIHWVVVGGESGASARPMHPDWARSIRDQCVAAGVALHFKQWGTWKEFGHDEDGPKMEEVEVGTEFCESLAPLQDGYISLDGHFVKRLKDVKPDTHYRGLERFGKKANAGRTLDGRTWDEFPKVAHA